MVSCRVVLLVAGSDKHGRAPPSPPRYLAHFNEFYKILKLWYSLSGHSMFVVNKHINKVNLASEILIITNMYV